MVWPCRMSLLTNEYHWWWPPIAYSTFRDPSTVASDSTSYVLVCQKVVSAWHVHQAISQCFFGSGCHVHLLICKSGHPEGCLTRYQRSFLVLVSMIPSCSHLGLALKKKYQNVVWHRGLPLARTPPPLINWWHLSKCLVRRQLTKKRDMRCQHSPNNPLIPIDCVCSQCKCDVENGWSGVWTAYVRVCWRVVSTSSSDFFCHFHRRHRA